MENERMSCPDSKKKRKKILMCSAAALAAVYLCLCVSLYPVGRNTSFGEENCMLYYIVNADGMKGLGHSILLLIDEEGCGTVLSFNGMQRSLGESLLGKSGIGKMSMGTMSPEETKTFLQTGNLNLGSDQLTDNYDMALYRPITEEVYQTVMEQTVSYCMAEEQFTALYESWAMEEDAGRKAEYWEELERVGQDESLPLYQIYTHNCDHAARILASSADSNLFDYTKRAWRMTPSGNFKAFAAEAENWGIMSLGTLSLPERILLFLMIF